MSTFTFMLCKKNYRLLLAVLLLFMAYPQLLPVQESGREPLRNAIIKKLNKHYKDSYTGGFKAHTDADTLIVEMALRTNWLHHDTSDTLSMRNTESRMKDDTYTLAREICRRDVMPQVKEAGYRLVLFKIRYHTPDHIDMFATYSIKSDDLYLLCNNMNQTVFFNLLRKVYTLL